MVFRVAATGDQALSLGVDSAVYSHALLHLYDLMHLCVHCGFMSPLLNDIRQRLWSAAGGTVAPEIGVSKGAGRLDARTLCLQEAQQHLLELAARSPGVTEACPEERRAFQLSSGPCLQVRMSL
jgi:hypothetical protein